MQSLHYYPFNHLPPSAPLSGLATANVIRRFDTTIVDARTSQPTAARPSWTLIMKTIKGLGLRLL
jgi:hypothetical protein